MATYLENLQTARDNLAAKLAEVSSRPNYTDGAGQSFDFGEMMDRLAKLDAAIAAGQGPVEIHSEH